MPAPGVLGPGPFSVQDIVICGIFVHIWSMVNVRETPRAHVPGRAGPGVLFDYFAKQYTLIVQLARSGTFLAPANTSIVWHTLMKLFSADKSLHCQMVCVGRCTILYQPFSPAQHGPFLD